MTDLIPIPFILSLSKDCSSSGRKEQGFDKLSPNGKESQGLTHE
jgi:hypothetical protein